MGDMKEFSSNFLDIAITYGTHFILAILLLVIGLSVIKRVVNFTRKQMQQKDIDPSLVPFLASLISTLLKALLIITAASMLGIQMTSFVALLGAAGLAIGLALQGSLANFAGGVLILILKPFKIGDFIEGGGVSGTVREIQIFYTYLTTAQGQEILVPNGALSNNSIVNYNFNPSRRIDMTFGIGYGDDIDKSKAILHQLCADEKRFLEDKGITIFVEALADNSVNIRVRGWSNTGDYWGILGDFNEKVKKAFDAADISIPYPQMDLHLVEDRTK
ncbi:MAG: small conductance mechanosensitive channel [Roseivirga sp.]|jgi:small conductance mechanosensitive channel